MIQPILQLGNPALHRQSASWDAFPGDDLVRLVEDLADTLHDAQRRHGYGRGVAAPQIDVLKRVIFVDTDAFTGPLINPSIFWASNEIIEIWDSCFSFSVAFFVLVDRHRSIKVQYATPDGDTQQLTAHNGLSELLQHEIDHLNGILATDRMKKHQMMMRSEWQSIQHSN